MAAEALPVLGGWCLIGGAVARSILNSMSTLEIVVLGVGGMVLLTLGAVVLARRLFPRLADGEFEPVADSLRVVYELIFALILAFVIAAVLDEMSNAEAAVASEATTIAELVRANEALPVEDRQRLEDSVKQYVKAVANHEWKTMKHGEPSPRATAALEGMYAEYRDVQPTGNAQTEYYSQALADLHDVASKRRERLNIAAADLPTMLRVLVVVGLVLLLVLEYRPQLSRVAGLVFMGMLALVTTSAFLLTVILNYPFAGQVSVKNEPFKQDTLARFWTTERGYEGQRGDRQLPLTAQGLEGVWNSDAYGTLVLRCHGPAPKFEVRRCRPGDTRMRAVFRYHEGTVTGELSGGVFRGWWTEGPSRRGPKYSGRVAWRRLLETSDGRVVTGSWGREHGPFEGSWDLEEIGGAAPPDLRKRFAELSAFREDPGARSQ